MKSWRNSHQRHKSLRAEESRDTLKFEVSEMAFPGAFNRYFPPWTPCCFVRIQVQDWKQCHRNVPSIPQHHMVQTFHRSKPV